ncbi:thioesterase domain-containing protein [Pseudomonas aeruginosa]
MPLRRRGLEGPLALFLSGVSPPAENDVSGYRRAKADAELVAALRDYRGTPEASLNDPSLMQDAVASGASGLSRHRQLPLPGARAAGRGAAPRSADARTACAAPRLLGWLHEAGGDFTLDLLDGQHFSSREQQGQLLRLLRSLRRPASAALAQGQGPGSMRPPVEGGRDDCSGTH